MSRALEEWAKIVSARSHTQLSNEPSQIKMKKALQYLGSLKNLASNVVLVTGTTGKSSTCRCLEVFGGAAHKRVGIFSSSYLYSLEELIRIQGKKLPEDYLCDLLEQTFPIVERVGLNHFEWLLFLALWVFKNAALDLVVLEIDFGGDQACIDLIDSEVSVITTIDYDHLSLLGETREEIARHKASILREGRWAVIGEPDPPKALIEQVQKLSVKAKWVGKDWSYQVHRDMRVTMKSLYSERLEVLAEKLPISCISTAVVVWELLYGKVPDSTLIQWIDLCKLAGRFEVIKGEPPIILDVAANPKSVRYLFHRLKEFEEKFDLRGWHAICSMSRRSLYEESLMPWTLEETFRWYFPKVEEIDALDPAKLRQIFLRERSMICDSSLLALHQARADASIRGAGVVVFGGEAILRALQDSLQLEWDSHDEKEGSKATHYPSNVHVVASADEHSKFFERF